MTPRDHEPLFSGYAMSAVAFASGSGTNFREAVRGAYEETSRFYIDLLLTDKSDIGAINYARDFGIDHDTINGYRACGSWQKAKQTVEGIEEYERRCQLFNKAMLEKVQKYEGEHSITFDFAVLAGYMRLFKGPLLRRFTRHALNVHPAALYILNSDGTRKYTGDNAVYDALLAGETRTRSSIILLDPEPDAGAILVSGPWVDFSGEVARESADEHQKKQKEASDWPALRFALRAIAHGELGLHRKKFHSDGNPVVIYRGREMPYHGFDMAASCP